MKYPDWVNPQGQKQGLGRGMGSDSLIRVGLPLGVTKMFRN